MTQFNYIATEMLMPRPFPDRIILCKKHRGCFRYYVHMDNVSLVTRKGGEAQAIYQCQILQCPKCLSQVILVHEGPPLASHEDEDWTEWLELIKRREGMRKVWAWMDMDNQDKDPIGSGLICW